MTDAADAALAEQYEAYPYPQRDPRDEAKRLIVGSPSHLREVDHWIFAGRRPAAAPLRALVAGGGSGDATVMLAQQMATAGREGEVTWLDRSAAARKVAEARVAARGLGNVAFREASILELPGSGLGPFDYIDCCGVLHHLPDPLEGLRALVSVLAPGGGLGLMVYAPHGRTGVYMMQDALRLIAPPGEAPAQRVDVAKRLWRQMPETAWLRRNPWITDHVKGGDAGIYDLLLNPRDVAFTVPALAALVDAAGLEIRCLVEPFRYDPDSFLSDPRLRERTARLSFIERAALAEAAAGNMGIHIAYCVRKGEGPPLPGWDDPDSIPILRELEGPKLAAQIPRDGVLRVSADGLTVPITLPRLAGAIVARIDGTRTMGDIRDELTELGIAPDAFARDYAATATALERVNRMLLKAR
ncbi:class I SAM-dependent methyltransferase [Neoroseomonas oryzicola]|uniref:Class I SAM-dependent methyltransferase n=1 Tax=Neoroseomonas oryzicola TaxID=535904 RepID=A0A9X9WPB3_9PROT|nr:class I SAM-dependent methyltransferase [Neoroseomonas oryzicola]MBR0662173.1 class I SAM-dependent methyltransferase [Neoroseomonas oryzicola]NKE18079.1 class I SAM-dependent methyltransferase [Neoroseomonas oryzicola]